MGLFSSETKTKINTSIQRMVRDDQITNSTKIALASALYSGDDLVDTILDAQVNTIATKLELMYQYAKLQAPYGMPSGEVFTRTSGRDAVQDLLESIEGAPISMEYYQLSDPNFIHMGWMSLISQYGYNPDTNELAVLSAQKGTKVYLDFMQAEIPGSRAADFDDGETDVLGTPPNAGYSYSRPLPINTNAHLYYKNPPAIFSDAVPDARIRVSYEWQTSTKVVWKTTRVNHTESIYLPPSELEYDADCYHAKYVVNGVTKYWMYRKGAGTYPSLDNMTEGGLVETGDYYPNIYFRLNKQKPNISSTKVQPFLGHKRMCGYFGIDYKTMVNNIHANEGISDIMQSFMTMGVPADTGNQVEMRYLFDYFDQVYQTTVQKPSGVTGTGFTQGVKGYISKFSSALSGRVVPANSITIRDAAYEMNLVYASIYKVRVPASGVIGSMSSGSGTSSYTVQVATGDPVTPYRDVVRTVNYRYYRKQISHNYYEEMRVEGLAMKYNISGKHHTVMGDDGGEILLVPLDRSVVRKYNSQIAEELVTRSLHLVNNSFVQYKVRWYEQGWFAAFIMVVGIALSIITMGADGGFFAQAGIAIAAGAYMSLVLLVATQVLIYVAISVAVKLFVKVVGVKLAFLVAIVAAAYGMGSILKDMTFQVSMTAKTLLQLASGIGNAVGNQVASLMGDLQSEMMAFMESMKTEIKLIEKAEDLLHTTSHLSPFVILGESPGDFYNRTVHSGNIGTLVYEDIHNYVARNLRLPTFNETMGGSFA